MHTEKVFFIRRRVSYLKKIEETLTINVPVVYIGRDEMILMRLTSISRAIGRGGP
jgi:hypothetical protein